MEIKLPCHWKVLDFLLLSEMEIYMYFLFKKTKWNIFLNYYFSLDGVYSSGVLNNPGSIASCQAVSCQLGLPLLAHLSVYFRNSGSQLCLKNTWGFTGCGRKGPPASPVPEVRLWAWKAESMCIISQFKEPLAVLSYLCPCKFPYPGTVSAL